MLKFITHRPLWLNIFVGVLLAIAIFSVFVLSLNWLTHHNVSKTVPNVTGKSFEEAERLLEKAGFEVEVIPYSALQQYYPLAIQRGECFLDISKPSILGRKSINPTETSREVYFSEFLLSFRSTSLSTMHM